MIAACSDCALVDIVCDEQIDLGAYPKLERGPAGQYKAPVVMAGADGSNRDNIEGDCHTYVDQSDDEQPLGRKSLEGHLESRGCKDKHQDDIDFDCWVESDHNDAGTATIVCAGCSPTSQSGFRGCDGDVLPESRREHGRPVQLRCGYVARGRHLNVQSTTASRRCHG